MNPLEIVKAVALAAVELVNRLPDASVSLHFADRDGDSDKDVTLYVETPVLPSPIVLPVPFGLKQIKGLIESL